MRCATAGPTLYSSGKPVGSLVAVGSAVMLCLAAEAVLPARGDEAAWVPLFDGKALGAWRSTPFGGEGEVSVKGGAIRIERGSDLSGITWSADFPRQGYEIELEARRIDGIDFFCGLTFPVGEEPCSLILGGWGGGVVGLSSIDGEDAAHNETTQVREFEKGRWYAVLVRVTAERIECDLDGERIVDQPLKGHTLSIRPEVEASRPLGIATYATVGELRGIRYRKIATPPGR